MPQAQFAGYYVAASKGYYAEENLDVTIDGGSTDVTPVQAIVGGRRRRRRSTGRLMRWPAARRACNLVNIAQPFKSSALLLICRKDMGITTSADFKGKTLGVWFFGNEYPFYAWMTKLGSVDAEGGADGVEVLQAGLRRRPDDPEAGGLHLGHDLQ